MIDVIYCLIVLYNMLDEPNDCMLKQPARTGQDHCNMVAVILSISIINWYVEVI